MVTPDELLLVPLFAGLDEAERERPSRVAADIGPSGRPLDRDPYLLETTVPGIFVHQYRCEAVI